MPDQLTTALQDVRTYIEEKLSAWITPESTDPHDRIEDLTTEEKATLAQQIADKIREPRDPVPGI